MTIQVQNPAPTFCSSNGEVPSAHLVSCVEPHTGWLQAATQVSSRSEHLAASADGHVISAGYQAQPDVLRLLCDGKV